MNREFDVTLNSPVLRSEFVDADVAFMLLRDGGNRRCAAGNAVATGVFGAIQSVVGGLHQRLRIEYSMLPHLMLRGAVARI